MQKKRAYHHGNLRPALIAAALEVLGERGIAGVTLRETARRVGVTHAAPYRHFADKAALLVAVSERGFNELYEQVTAVYAAAGDNPRDKLTAMARAYIRFAMERPALYRLMIGRRRFEPGEYPSHDEATQKSLSALVDTIRGGQEAGLIREGDPDKLGLVAWASTHGLASILIDGRVQRSAVEEAQELATLAAETLWEGLAKRD